MKNKVIASKEYIILGLIGFLLVSFCLCAVIDVFHIDNLLFINIVFILAIAFLIGICIVALVLLYIGAHKYWIDCNNFLCKTNIFHVKKKVSLNDIVLIMKIQTYNYSDSHYLIIEKDFFNKNKSIIKHQSTIVCNEKSRLLIDYIMAKEPTIKYGIDLEVSWYNYCLMIKKIKSLLKKAQKKSVSLKINYFNGLKAVEIFDFQNIDIIQAEINLDGKFICEEIYVVKNHRLKNGQYSRGFAKTPNYDEIKKKLQKIK